MKKSTRILIFSLWGIFGAVLFVAQAEERSSSGDWLQRREELLLLIEATLNQEVEAELPAAQLAQEMGLPYPVPPPEKSRDEIFSAVRDQVRDSVPRPARDLAVLSREAEALYPLFRVGDQVTLRSNLPNAPPVSGTIYQISATRVQLGHRWLLCQDLVDEDRIALDEARTMARRTNYVTQQLRLTNAAIQAQQQQKLNQILPAQMTQAGYVCLDQQNQELFTPDVWQARDQYFQNALQEARAAIATRLRPAIEKRIFSENGFRYYENRKEWRPKGVLHQIKTFFAD